MSLRGRHLAATVSIPALALLTMVCCARAPRMLDGVEVAWTGHEEVVIEDDFTVTPLLLGGTPINLCLHAPPTLDTSAWQASLSWRENEDVADPTVEPTRRMASTLCWRAPDPPPSASSTLCGRVHDTVTGAQAPLPCRTVLHAPERADARADLQAQLRGATIGAEGTQAIVARLDAIADAAREQAFPLQATYSELAAVHFLVQGETAAGLAQATARLDRLPPWIVQPEVDVVAGQAAFQRARLALAAGWRLADAWQDLREADRHYLRVAAPLRIVVPEAEAGLLARLGATAQAIERLQTAIDDCAEARCDSFLVNQARANAGFWTLIDPGADPPALEAAEASLRAALDATAEDRFPGERANWLVNLALARVRLGGDPADWLTRARALLGQGTEIGAARRAVLSGWADLVDGLAALASDRPAEALARCEALATAERTPRLTAWSLDCAARAHRRLGSLDAAAAAYDQLFDFYQYATPEALGQDVPLGPSQRAVAFYRAVRVAVERGRPDEGWALLDRLDGLSASESSRRACREGLTDPALLDAWRDRDRRRAELSARLRAFAAPVSGRRRQQQAASERATREALDELARTWPGCLTPAPRVGTTGPEVRALAVEDEVLLLRRDGAGVVTLARRTPMPRRVLADAVATLSRALDQRALDDDAWRAAAAAVARAVVPDDPARDGAVLAFGLYGSLQAVPLAALPRVPSPTVDDLDPPPWLGEVVLPVVVPVGLAADAGPPTADDDPRPALFVIDPTRDLPAASALLGFYREQFPDGRQLHGAEATGSAMLAALPTSSSLHVDAHLTYDPTFPTLSSLELADGPLRLVDLEELDLRLRFANLSACDSGRWPVTADRGRFGLAGRLARAGVSWVVASRAVLDDQLAGAFNRAFYRALRERGSVPEAYAAASKAVRVAFPAAQWGALQLLRGTPGAASPVATRTFFVPRGAKGTGDHSSDDERDAHARADPAGSASNEEV